MGPGAHLLPDTSLLTTGWATGVALGAYISSPISGGHINPAVTIVCNIGDATVNIHFDRTLTILLPSPLHHCSQAQAVFRRFPLSKVPGYILSQILGCFFATLIIYVSLQRGATPALPSD